jgi:hypothetical protein
MDGLFPIRLVHTLNVPFGVVMGITLIPPVCTPLSNFEKYDDAFSDEAVSFLFEQELSVKNPVNERNK